MIYLELLIGFLKVGCFAFGGAYGAIPLIRDVVMSYGWLTDEALSYMIAVSESTPGPIGVNMATYVGFTSFGIFVEALLFSIISSSIPYSLDSASISSTHLFSLTLIKKIAKHNNIIIPKTINVKV